MTAALLLLGFVTAERLAELWLARRNTRRLLGQGGVEFAAGHYPLIVALHAAWLAGVWILGSGNPVIGIWLVAFLVLQGLRLWVLASLGPRWTTRIIIVPGAPLVSSGPYRFFAHPNYLVVIGEIAVLPLALDLPWFAFIFTVANAVVLAIRIRAENMALRQARHV